MKALVKYAETSNALEIREVSVPEIGDTDVLLEVQSVGICGSDIEMWHHHIGFVVDVPVTQGHEFSGIIKKIGSQVKEFKVGDRVVSETASYICGVCSHCRSGEYNLCPTRKGYGAKIDGAFANYARVPERILHRIPDGVDFDAASLTEPAAVAYNAIFIKSEMKPGEPVVIIGPGPIGLFAVQMARIGGAFPIVLIGTEEDVNRLEVGQQVGADITINVHSENAVERVDEITGGLGAPLVIDCAGNNAAFKSAMDMVKRNGQITKIGWGPKPLDMSLDPLIAKAACLQGTFSHTWSTWEAVLQLIASGKIWMKPMITHTFPLVEWETGFTLADQKVAVKAIIHPNDNEQ